MYHVHDWMMEGYEWIWWTRWVSWIVWTLLLAGVAVWLFRTSSEAKPERISALELLQRTYAEGKISTKEYEERKRHLTEL